MTVLALKSCRRANAVSSLHGQVSRAMWRSLYPGSEEHVPIGHITNGVHVQTWLAPQMRQVYDRHFGPDWPERAGDPGLWEAIDNVDDGELWETHQTLKVQLIDVARRTGRAAGRGARRAAGASSSQLRRALSLDALTIGFARRFATYKRANLILQDMEAIASLVNNPQMPIQFVFAGKSHPHDSPGKEMLQQIARLTRDPRFAGKLLFVEDYDINVGRHLVQGVDVWLNNPRRPLEACGTSGQKVVLNGGLNLSVLDGWWAEGVRRPERVRDRRGRDAHVDRRSRSRDGDALLRASRQRHSALLRPRPRRPAARVDRADEARDPHARLAVQRRPHGRWTTC